MLSVAGHNVHVHTCTMHIVYTCTFACTYNNIMYIHVLAYIYVCMNTFACRYMYMYMYKTGVCDTRGCVPDVSEWFPLQ